MDGIAGRPGLDAGLDEYRRAIRDVTRLNRLLALLEGQVPVSELADRVVLALSELFAADVVAILRSAPGGDLLPLGAIGLPDEGRSAVFSGDDAGYPATAIARRGPVGAEVGSDDPRLDPCLRALGVRSTLWIPLLEGTGAPGVLLVARCRPPAFSRDDADLLLAMAQRISLVIERAEADEERRRLEALRSRAEKAESLMRVAGAVAHHFNNKLTAVMGYLHLAEESLPPGSPALPDLRIAGIAAQEAGEVGRLLLDYLGQDFEPRQVIDLGAVAREGVEAFAPLAPDGVEVGCAVVPHDVLVAGAPRQLREVLDHLLENGVEAAAACGGSVRVRVLELRGSEGPLACLEVADDGCGMPAEAVGVAFEPFYSTKAPGRGLGLPAVMGLVQAHGGSVTVESEPDQGTVVRVLLPLVQPGADG